MHQADHAYFIWSPVKLMSDKASCFYYNDPSLTDLQIQVLYTDVGTAPAGTSMGGPKCFSLYSNDMIYCFKNNKVFCLMTIARPIIKCFLRVIRSLYRFFISDKFYNVSIDSWYNTFDKNLFGYRLKLEIC